LIGSITPCIVLQKSPYSEHAAASLGRWFNLPIQERPMLSSYFKQY
jgi:hypothetical protein